MSFATMARRAAAVAVLALALALPVAAAQEGVSVPVTVRTDGAGSAAVYTVGITPQGTAPAPAQTSLQIKNGGTAYFTGLSFDEPGDYTYRVAQAKGSAPYTSYDARAYTVTVRVTTRPDGTLRTELWAVRDGETAKADSLVFVNRYDPPVPTPTPTAAPVRRAAPAKTPTLPQTGDDFPLEALAAAMCAGVVGFGTAFKKRK